MIIEQNLSLASFETKIKYLKNTFMTLHKILNMRNKALDGNIKGTYPKQNEMLLCL